MNFHQRKLRGCRVDPWLVDGADVDVPVLATSVVVPHAAVVGKPADDDDEPQDDEDADDDDDRGRGDDEEEDSDSDDG